ncbi:MerR family transcriptional regulator [Glaciecola sp. 2405UD65-10]|uniref:MerR family transcriptional regulator n=1 Tax=Glaciecola sp. 2405UD65-10 TaxID=3397244 RepID=UPI003B591DC0
MKISQLAKATNLSAHTLRYYEKLGLLVPQKSIENNYRIYNSDDLATAHFIKRCKESGFSLEDTAALINIKDAKDQHTCAEAKAITQKKVDEVHQQIKRLSELKQVLKQLNDKCCGGTESAQFCSIISQLENTQNTKEPEHATG